MLSRPLAQGLPGALVAMPFPTELPQYVLAGVILRYLYLPIIVPGHGWSIFYLPYFISQRLLYIFYLLFNVPNYRRYIYYLL